MNIQLLWPLHWLRLLTEAKDFSANPVMANSRLNAWGLHVLRKRLAHGLCQWRRVWLQRGLPVHAAKTLAEQGVLHLVDFLEREEFNAIRNELLRLALPMIEMAQPPALTRHANLDAGSCERQYPALYRLITHKTLLRLLRYAAGYPGTPIIAVQCIHSDHDGNESAPRHDPQTDWHMDTFHSTAKAWLFLHDVGLNDGPFAYIPGSHRLTPQRLAWEQRQSIMAAAHPNRLHAKGSFRISGHDLTEMGCEAPYLGTVKGNTLVVADTSGFHRRTASAQRTVRVEVHLSLRRNPFFAGLYPSLLGLPVIRSRWSRLAFWLDELRLKFGRPGWIPAAQRGLRGDEKEALGRNEN
jgi:hypothetical protein